MKYHYIAASLLSFSAAVTASELATVSFALDNDGIYGSDEDYSNGIFVSYTSGSIKPYWLFQPLSLSYWGASSLDKVEVQLGHKIWTPTDIEASYPLENDRPYAGYFHGEFNYISLHPEQAHRFNLTIGTTGENSYADRAQRIVHSIVGSSEPQGWEYQIDNKVVGSLGYLSHFNLLRKQVLSNSSWELSNVSEANIGNFRSDVSTGFMLRFGTDLHNNFGAANISAENPFKAGMIGTSGSAWFSFIGAELRYRFNDHTIEGARSALPEPQDRYDVDLQHLQTTLVTGIAWYNRHVGASLTLTGKNADYKQASNGIHGNGAISLFAFF
jgi:hypothetical protein